MRDTAPNLANALLERVSEVWNFYGPTETTVWSVCTRLGPEVTDPVPMGRPIANTTCYILDDQRRLQPLGVAGELYIGGIGLARGYLGRPDLTDDRFVDDPFAPVAGARMYRTGDLVRQREDGTLVFIGRTDHQVKLRGFRIELGEIESALAAQPGIAQAVVTMREDQPGDRRLVAYVVWTSDQAFDEAALAGELRVHLPAYMVPSAIVGLAEFPLTPNGKLDRKALPAPVGRQSSMASVPPRDAREAQLLALCHEVLGTDAFGVTDDFFDVGFESIMAARLFTRIERTFGVDLPLATVFQAPTVAGLAQLLGDTSALERGTRLSALVPIAGGGSAPAFFGVHGGAGTSLLYQPLAHLMADQRPFYGIQAVGLYGRESPQTSVEDMASRYIAEMKSVQWNGNNNGLSWRAMILPQSAKPDLQRDQLQQSGRERQQRELLYGLDHGGEFLALPVRRPQRHRPAPLGRFRSGRVQSSRTASTRRSSRPTRSPTRSQRWWPLPIMPAATATTMRATALAQLPGRAPVPQCRAGLFLRFPPGQVRIGWPGTWGSLSGRLEWHPARDLRLHLLPDGWLEQRDRRQQQHDHGRGDASLPGR